MAEDFVRQVCDTCGLHVHCSTVLTKCHCVVYLKFTSSNDVFEVVGEDLNSRDAYKMAWMRCFENSRFTKYIDSYVSLLDLNNTLDTMNLYNLD